MSGTDFNLPESALAGCQNVVNKIFNFYIVDSNYNYRLENFTVYGLTPLATEVIYNDTNNDAYSQNTIRLEIFDSRAYTAIQIEIPARESPLDSAQVNALTLCEVEVYGGNRVINAFTNSVIMPDLRTKTIVKTFLITT